VEAALITYSNESKVELLGISLDVLETFGAVSIAVAWAMARGALAKTRADVAVAITGIAGPAGGGDRKPVGTVVFARARRDANPDEVVADKREFGDIGRGGVRLQAALCALELLMPDSLVP
jgi:nicotinamide-nucleotide amidase